MKKITSLIAFLTLLSWQGMAQFTEDFEGVGTPAGWTVINNNSDAQLWTFIAPGTGTANGGTQVARIDYSSVAHDDYLVTPQIAVVDQSTDRLTLYGKSRSASFLEDFNILISTTGTNVVDFSTQLTPTITAPDTWTQYEYDLSAYEGQNIYIAFQAISLNQFELYLDDITNDAQPSCLTPSVLMANNLTATSADLAWTDNAGVSLWDIEWGATGFTQGTGTMVTGTSTNPHNLTGLTTSTSYEFYVRADCGGSGASAWVGPYSFTTTISCPAPSGLMVNNITGISADLAWTDNAGVSLWDVEWGTTGFVQGAGTMVSGTSTNPHNLTGLTASTSYEFYVRADCGGSGASTWVGPYSFFTGHCQVVSTSASSYVDDFSTTGGATNISNLTSGYATSGYEDATAMVVSQYATAAINFNAEFVGTTVGVNIWVDWNNDLDFDDLGEDVYASGSYISSATGSITVPAATPIGNYRMRIRCDYNTTSPNACGTSGSGRNETEDYTFSVIAQPSCLAPTALMVNNITSISVDLAWTDNAGVSLWDVEWGTTGFVQGAGTMVTGTSTNPHNLTGLTASTFYEFYVRADCGGSTSTWTGPYTFFTGHCQVVSTNASSYVDDFSTTGGATNISNLTSGYATNGYEDATAMVVSQYATAAINFNAGFVGTTVGVNIWVDWNNDLDFDDLGEDVYASGSYISAATGSITVPAATPIGNYRMRIRCDYNATSPNACGTSGSGRNETEDYTFSVIAQPSCLPPTALMVNNHCKLLLLI